MVLPVIIYSLIKPSLDIVIFLFPSLKETITEGAIIAITSMSKNNFSLYTNDAYSGIRYKQVI